MHTCFSSKQVAYAYCADTNSMHLYLLVSDQRLVSVACFLGSVIMNMSYEQDQARLQKFFEEFLSDEESDDNIRDKDYESDSDSGASSSSYEGVTTFKRPRKQQSEQNVPSTSQSIGVCSRTIENTIEHVISEYQLPNDESSGEDDVVDNNIPLGWQNVDSQSLKNISFSVENSGIKPEFFEMYDKEPIDLFKLFVNGNVLELIVKETNRYERQKLNRDGHGPKARIHKWKDTNIEEIKTFLGLVVWMGLEKLPKLCSYWSKNSLYNCRIIDLNYYLVICVLLIMRGQIQKYYYYYYYYKCKRFIDISDQIKSYSPAIRKSLKWYRKIAIELLLGSTIVNSYIIYQNVTNNKLSITSFKEKLVMQLINVELTNAKQPTVGDGKGHHLEEVGSSNRRCVACYAKNSEENGRKFAQLKTTFSRFKCIQCDKFYCITCFCNVHLRNL
ncbi:piggybac transposable element-derived protein 4 [Holotrichia oblita]|uniref:Piggybac transposable element-derived protein 4 n=1 Tax=Holotrichia oblita TaxID=644536 RepID=A0ACB9SR07_HOLOL|nr:piggybac transposable element-derived protein 4 [Holotrichia oblita]